MPRTALKRVAIGIGLALATAISGCDSKAPSAPTPPPAVVLSGTWSGSGSDSSGPGQITWQLTQTDSSFAGTLTMVDTATKVTGRGSVTGTLAQSSIHFSMSVPAGGFDPPYESCSSAVSGDGLVSGSSVQGSYSGVNSCTGTGLSGQIALTRSP